MENARLLVIGAGVNGSAVAVRLFNRGVDVRLLARGRRYEFIRDEGVVIENPFNHKRSVIRVPVIDRLDPADCYDYILVVVRKNQLAALLPSLAQNSSPNIVFMGNNLAGPEEFTRVVDRRRIMLGSVVAGGKRDGEIIRAMINLPASTPFGEMDGKITPRLDRLVKILRQGGIKAIPSTDIVDHQMTHAAAVALIATLVMKYDCDLAAMSRSKEDLINFVLARREAQRVLRALGHKIVPRSDENLEKIPVFLQAAFMRPFLKTKFAEVGLAYHVSQAPDEVKQLASELAVLVERSGLETPAIRQILGSFPLSPASGDPDRLTRDLRVDR